MENEIIEQDQTIIDDNAVQLFSNPAFGSIRTLLIDNEPWFSGIDVAKVLDYKNQPYAVRTHVREKNKMLWKITTPGGVQTMTIINEPGFYSLVFRSKNKIAEDFQEWVYSEVLPTLRKTGSYTLPEEKQQPSRKDYIEAGKAIATCRKDRLPTVLDAFRKGGLDLEYIEPTKPEAPERHKNSKYQKDPYITEQQRKKLDEVFELHSCYEIADAIGCSGSTIKNHRYGYRKVRSSRYKLIMKAFPTKK